MQVYLGLDVNFRQSGHSKGKKWAEASRRRLRNLLRSRSIELAFRKTGIQSKIVQAILLPWLFILMMAFRVLRLARNIRRRLHLGIRVKEALQDPSRDTRVLSVLVSLFLTLRAGLRFARNGLRHVRRAARTWLREVLFDPLRKTRAGQLLQHLTRLLLTSRGVDRFLKAVQPDLIVLPEDNVETLSTIFVAKGRGLNIPSMVIPFTIPNPLEPARYYFDNPLYEARGPFARRLVNQYPKWRFHHDGRDLLRQPAVKALCQEFLGLSSPAPWILNRGWAVSIALDSEAQRDLYEKLGFPVEQLKIVGDMNGALFHRARSLQAAAC